MNCLKLIIAYYLIAIPGAESGPAQLVGGFTEVGIGVIAKPPLLPQVNADNDGRPSITAADEKRRTRTRRDRAVLAPIAVAAAIIRLDFLSLLTSIELYFAVNE